MARELKQKKLSPEKWFELVVSNAIHFLYTSVDNLETSPRNALIDLHTAIELFFKARLMKEHWCLILNRPDQADLLAFESGNFQSVTLDQAERRLTSICSEQFKPTAISNFKKLNEHRNQIVHFAHTDFADRKAEIAIEHWASWFYLHQILTDQWKAIFTDSLQEIEKLNLKISKNSGFLQVKYNEIAPVLSSKKESGLEIVECKSCNFESGVVYKTNAWGKNYECLVCNVHDVALKDISTQIACESCGANFAYFLLKKPNCPICEESISTRHALSQYTKIYEQEDPEGRLEEGSKHIAHCHNCQTDQASVVMIEGLWVCILCKDRGWTAIDCEHCESFVTGDLERIAAYACHLCEDAAYESYLLEKKEFEEDMEQDDINLYEDGIPF